MDPEEEPTLYTYYFTFGRGHHMGPQKKCLRGNYTTIRSTDSTVASTIIGLRRGPKWSYVYGSAESAGVKKFNLTYIPFEEVLPQEGQNL